jgi:hypothetical protein
MSKATDYLTANNHFLLIVFTLCLSLWTAFFQTTSAVFADNLPDSEIQALNEYPNWVGGSACSTSVNTPGSSSSIDLSSIAQKYNLQSAIVEQVGGNAIGSYSSDQPPTTPASTMKLIIADVLIRSGLSLDKKITITPDMVYGPGYSAGDKPTLGDAMDQMLSVSSNTAANGLIEALGGFAGITSKANSYGYTNTNIKSYYSVAGDAVNQSTIGDEANAMNHIFTTSGGSYTEAQADLESAAKNDNFYNVSDDANKWAGTTQVAGDVAKLSSGGTDYIIGVYSNESDSQGQSSGNIKDSIAAIASAVQSSNGSSSQDPSTDNGSSSSSCSCTGSGTTNFGSGSLPSSVPSPYNGIFTAAANKFDIAPALLAAIFYGGEHGNSFPDPPPPYGNGSPWASSSAGAEGPFQFEPQTWAEYQQDGNGDGVKDVQDLADAAFGAADYLAASGAKNSTTLADLEKAIFAYNHAQFYVNDVIAAYNKFGGASGGSGSSGTTTPTPSGSGSSSNCGGAGGVTAQSGSVQAAVQAARLLSSMNVGYIWGGSHGTGEIATTDITTLVKQGMDCSSSVSWVLHQAGMLGTSADDSTTLESWGDAGQGQEMTIWTNPIHAFIEFNVPGLGHYELDTVNAEGNSTANTQTPGATGPGPRFFPVDSSDSPGNSPAGFTPRHWVGT